MEYLSILLLLVFFHFLADYPLQGDFLSKAKNRTSPIPGVPWYQAMSAHCGIHAGFVFVATGSVILSLFEFVVHFVTDDLKCQGKLSFDQDQIIHLAAKAAIIGALFYAV